MYRITIMNVNKREKRVKKAQGKGLIKGTRESSSTVT